MLAVVLTVVAIVAVLAVVRLVVVELRPSEIDRFQQASSLTSAWSRGEQSPPVYPQEPAQQDEDQRPSTPLQGLPRNSRT
ncbi:MAG: hypothetical protein QOE24_3095 [Frankiales bacterium]|nr:hypothetical protein [Frankiales bacterium]MDX6210704.1 hypothetical protein [Frankiales bacterium]